jgi:drug/metabolite transporter (DMT)-like permease
VLAVIFGRLFFGEKNIRDKLAAASMMFVGVLILYLPLTTAQAAATAAAAIAAMLLYMLLVPPGATADLATQRD